MQNVQLTTIIFLTAAFTLLFRFITLLAGVTEPVAGWSSVLMIAMIVLEVIAMIGGLFLATLTILVLAKVCLYYRHYLTEVE